MDAAETACSPGEQKRGLLDAAIGERKADQRERDVDIVVPEVLDVNDQAAVCRRGGFPTAAVDEPHIVARTDNGDDLLDIVDRETPDAALVDVSMRGPGP